MRNFQLFLMIPLALAVIFFACNSKQSKSTDDIVKEIDNAKDYKLDSSLAFNSLTTYFMKGDEVVKVFNSHGGSKGGGEFYFYYTEGKLIHINESSKYRDMMSEEGVEAEDNKFYFENEKLVNWLQKDKKNQWVKVEDAAKIKERESHLIDFSKSVLADRGTHAE